MDSLIAYIKEHAAELGVIVPVVLFVFGIIGFFIRRFFFADGKPGTASGVAAGRDVIAQQGGVIATDHATVHAEMIGGEKRVVNQQNFIAPVFTFTEAPFKPKEERRDEIGRKNVDKLMALKPTMLNKQELFRIFADTKDKDLKVQIALIFGAWFDPIEDCIAELVEISNEAIFHLREVHAKKPVEQLAALLAYKAIYISSLFTRDYLAHAFKEATGTHNNAGLMALNKREIDYQERIIQQCFIEAEQIAKEVNDPEVLALVYMEKGQAAAHRASTFTAVNIPARFDEVKIVRESFALAEQVFRDAREKLPNAGELEIANVRHNYANSLRMLGPKEAEEAKAIETQVIELAKKHGDHTLLTKAQWVLEHLDAESIPNYCGGEKGKSLI